MTSILDPKHEEIVDYEKEEQIEKITDLPEQTPDASCTRTLSFSRRLFIDRTDYQAEMGNSTDF